MELPPRGSRVSEAHERLAETKEKLWAEIKRADRRGEEITAQNLHDVAALVESQARELADVQERAEAVGRHNEMAAQTNRLLVAQRDQTEADLAAVRQERDELAKALRDHLRTHNGEPDDSPPLCSCSACVLGRAALAVLSAGKET